MSVLIADGVLFGAVALFLAAATAPLVPDTAFAAMRLLCQGQFGETVAQHAWLAAFHVLRRQRRRGLLLAGITLVLLAVYAEAYHHGPRDLRLRRHVLRLGERDRDRDPAALGAPPVGAPLRIVHLTDLQTPSIGAHEERALRLVLAQQPDLIVLTGDYVEERFAPTYRRAAADLNALLRRLQFSAPLGVYAVEGDVDEYVAPWPRLFAGLPVTCLRDESRRLMLPGGGTLALTGLTLATSGGEKPDAVRATVALAPPADLHLVIGHRPDFVRALPGRGVDLCLAGHTHGGQVVVPFFGPPVTMSGLPRRCAGGLHAWNGVPLHVSRGVGMERGAAPQIRFLCPPEVCVVEVIW